MSHRDTWTLAHDELTFFRLTCDVFPSPESPLRFLAETDVEPPDPTAVFETLRSRGWLRNDSTGAADLLLEHLRPVSECSARVSLTHWVGGTPRNQRCFYLTEARAVEYRREGPNHVFGAPKTETQLVEALVAMFPAPRKASRAPLSMSAAEYLAFAVFARDARTERADSAAPCDESPMSLDEVLAYFDEPETKQVRTPSDDDWDRAVSALCERGVLCKQGDGHTLHQGYRELASEITADNHHTVSRLDYLEEHWLAREVNLFPTPHALYRVDPEPDGSVAVAELTVESLRHVLGEVVCTLPNILSENKKKP